MSESVRLRQECRLGRRQRVLETDRQPYRVCRKATKVRNVVERLFATLKKWKFLRYEHDIHYDPEKIHDIWLIICCFHNAFGNPLYSDLTNQEEDAERIMGKQHITKNVIKSREAKLKSGWKQQKVPELQQQQRCGLIPKFNLKSLRKLCNGPYQLKLAVPYCRHANKVKFMRHKESAKKWKEWNTIRTVGIVSRHSRNDASKKMYQVYHRARAGFLIPVVL